jgi:hypothetical protein
MDSTPSFHQSSDKILEVGEACGNGRHVVNRDGFSCHQAGYRT